MISAEFDLKKFNKDMKNIIGYSIGFLDGVELGKTRFSAELAKQTIETLKEFIDSNARVSPSMLHHVYEWNQTGSPSARLFDISYIVNGSGISVNSTFRQSTSVQDGSKTPFYDKARIMESGVPVRIVPKKKVLAFTDQKTGEKVFTSKPVKVSNPGGLGVENGYESAFDSFFNNYFSQAFLQSSGIAAKLKDTSSFGKNLRAGKTRGRTKGVQTGFQWISEAGAEA